MTPKTPTSPAKRQAPRMKHVPQRMCVACRDHASKRGLTRVVRTPEGAVDIDETGKRNGRGAYLCSESGCWDKALNAGLLSRALNTTIDTDTQEKLRAYGRVRANSSAGQFPAAAIPKEL